MICGIYKIENLINHKCYIGQSVDIKRRWRQHKTVCSEGTRDYPLYRAFKKYGLENFSFEVLEECPREALNEREQYYIEKYNAYNNGYNQAYIKSTAYLSTPQLVKDIIKELQTNKTDNTEVIGKKFGVSGRTIRAINTGEAWYDSTITYPIRRQFTNQEHPEGVDLSPTHCIKCGAELKIKNSKYCQKCFHELSHRVEWPDRETLKKEIRQESFCELGRRYNVSDKAITKWCIYYNLPHRKKDIKSHSDEEWEKI